MEAVCISEEYSFIPSNIPWAILALYLELFKRFSSVGLEMNEVSTSILGISAPINTINGAFFTPLFLNELYLGATLE